MDELAAGCWSMISAADKLHLFCFFRAVCIQRGTGTYSDTNVILDSLGLIQSSSSGMKIHRRVGDEIEGLLTPIGGVGQLRDPNGYSIDL